MANKRSFSPEPSGPVWQGPWGSNSTFQQNLHEAATPQKKAPERAELHTPLLTLVKRLTGNPPSALVSLSSCSLPCGSALTWVL